MIMDCKMQYCQDARSFQLDYRFNAISIKIATCYITDIDKLILKFILRDKRPRLPKIILKEKNKIGGLTLPEF